MKKMALNLALAALPLMSFASISSTPTCPVKLTQYPLIYAVEVNDSLEKWGAVSAALPDQWDSVFAGMNDASIQNAQDAIAIGNKIEETQLGLLGETKVYDSSNTYFWACDYKVAPQYLKSGDHLHIFSSDYTATGNLTSKQLSTTKKEALFERQR